MFASPYDAQFCVCVCITFSVPNGCSIKYFSLIDAFYAVLQGDKQLVNHWLLRKTWKINVWQINKLCMLQEPLVIKPSQSERKHHVRL